MIDPFDRPVDWSEPRTVAGPATAAATSGNGGKPAFLPVAGDKVAAVATVAVGCADGSFAEGVADHATAIATAESGGKLPKTDVYGASVASVAAVARSAPLARPTTPVATPGNGRFPPMPTAFPDAVAALAPSFGAEHWAGSVAGRATAPATGRPQTEGRRLAAALSARLACHVADVAETGDVWHNPLCNNDYSQVSQIAVANPATLVATPGGNIPASPPPPVATWAAGVQRLRRSPAVKLYHGRWYQMVADARAFLALWAEDALRAGWDTLDVFGVNRDPLHARYDRLGLVVLLKGRPVQEIGPDSATVGNSAKDVTTYYRQRRAAGGVPVWQWCSEFPQ